MEENLIRNAQAYVAERGLGLGSRLGFGMHGIIFTAEGNSGESQSLAITVLKVHRYREPYEREKAVYHRLNEARISSILGFNVPVLLGYDDARLIIEMTVVERPFVLDFAGAYLDFPPEFSDEVWADWEFEKKEQFGNRWPQVQNVLAALEELDIHLVDVSPSNVAFAN